jgi:hypothetical protein
VYECPLLGINDDELTSMPMIYRDDCERGGTFQGTAKFNRDVTSDPRNSCQNRLVLLRSVPLDESWKTEGLANVARAA